MRAQISTPVALSIAITSPINDISTRPAVPMMRPECSGNMLCVKMSPALPVPGTSLPAGSPVRESKYSQGLPGPPSPWLLATL